MLKKTKKLQSTTFNGVPILRNHSPRVRAKEIFEHFKRNEFTRVLIIGKPGSGKTTLFDMMAHLLHQEFEAEKMQYGIHRFSEDQISKFDQILESLQGGNHIICFDDVSFLTDAMGSKQKAVLKNQLMTTRHSHGGKNKVIIFLIIHYTKALDKAMRDSDFQIFTTVGNEEYHNIMTLLQLKNDSILRKFQSRFKWMNTKGFMVINNVEKMKKRRLFYHHDKPFRICLWSGLEIYFMVFAHKSNDKGHDISCDKCMPNETKKPIDPGLLLDYLKSFTPRDQIGYIIRLMMFRDNGVYALHPHEEKVYHLMNHINKCYQVNHNKLLEHITDNEQILKRNAKDGKKRRTLLTKKHISDFEQFLSETKNWK